MKYKKKPLKISNLKHRIVQATQKKQPRKVRDFQRLLTKNLLARIQTILIASTYESDFLFVLYDKTNQIKSLKFTNSDFLQKFVLAFYKRILNFFFIVNKTTKKFDFFSKKENQKMFFSKKQDIRIQTKSLLSFLKKNQKNSLFFFHRHLSYSPILETLLKKTKEKKFRDPSEILHFLNHFCFKSRNFSDLESESWILKLEIRGFSENLHKSWLFKNFPIESKILKKNLEHLKKKTCTRHFFLENHSQQLFHREFFKKAYFTLDRVKDNHLECKKNFLNFRTNFENFSLFSLIGLETYLKDCFSRFNEFYMSELISPQISMTHEKDSQFLLNQFNSFLESKSFLQTFYYPQSIYVTGIHRRQFKQIIKFVNLFLEERGLELDVNKTTYFNLKKGFDLLGWTLKKTKKNLKVQISESFLLSQKKEIKWLIKNSSHEPLDKLIFKLNKKIQKDLIEYENQRFLKISENIETVYKNLNFYIDETFWKWAKKRHNHRSKSWIFKKYWVILKEKKVLKTGLLNKKVLRYKKNNLKNSLNFVFKNLYFLNFYSLDYQTQYCFFTSLLNLKSRSFRELCSVTQNNS